MYESKVVRKQVFWWHTEYMGRIADTTTLDRTEHLIPLREAAFILGITPRYLRKIGVEAGVLRRVTPRGAWAIPASVVARVFVGQPIGAGQ